MFIIIITIFGTPKTTVVYYEQSFLSKELYEAPSTSVVGVRFEGIICQSLGNRNPYIPTDENPFGN